MLLSLIFPLSIFIGFVGLANADDPAQQAYETFEIYSNQKTLNNDYNSRLESDAKNDYLFHLEAMKRGDGIEAAQKTESMQRENANANDEKRQQIFEKGTVVGGISNKIFAENEEFRRNKLGLDQEDQLYIFVSRSMPEELLRSYALDAAYTSAVLVMRGVKEEETLDAFFRGQLMQDLKPNGAGAMVQLDPRLFDAFEINVVPTIVFTNSSLMGLCATPNSSNVRCESVDKETYFKLSGSVTLKYALDQFIEKGADAHRFLKNLKGNYLIQPDNPREMVGTSSEAYRNALESITYDSAITDTQFEYQQDTHLLETENYPTPFGTVKAPKGTQMLLKKLSN